MKLASPPSTVTQLPRRPVALIPDPHRWPAWLIPVLVWVGIPALAVVIVLMLH